MVLIGVPQPPPKPVTCTFVSAIGTVREPSGTMGPWSSRQRLPTRTLCTWRGAWTLRSRARARRPRRPLPTSKKPSSSTSRTRFFLTIWNHRLSPPCASLRESGSSGSLGSRSGPSSGQGWLRSGQPTRKPRQTTSRRWSGCHRATPQGTRPRDAAVCSTPGSDVPRRVCCASGVA